jgi:SAM-dependent methyltransferase
MRLLHAGCGNAAKPHLFEKYEEVRLDIDRAASPDVVASITNMGDIGEFDAVYSSHNLEHLYPHEVHGALREFYRVLKVGGYLLVMVPDLEGLVIDESVIFESEGGPIRALDLLYGYRPMVAENAYMAHHCGFTRDILMQALKDAGFTEITSNRGSCRNLYAIAFRRAS